MKMRKVLTTMVAVLVFVMLMSIMSFAATTDLFKDGAFNGGRINSTDTTSVVNGVIQGPGNWTQLNLGDYAVDAPYLHVIVSCTGDTSKASFVISDTYTVNLVADLGVTLTTEYQDVVLPVEDNGITALGWCNLMGLDGGSTVYSVKAIFLSDSAASTIAAAPVADTTATPKTGSSDTMAIVLLIAMIGSAVVFYVTRKNVRA